jgi:hypothetical protein
VSKKFKNTSKKVTKSWMGEELRPNEYGYDQPSDYLRLYSRALQAVVSQAASHKFTGEFHTGECGIYKAEGGCSVRGGGELVLHENSCRFDTYHADEAKQQQCAELITKIVLEWDPMDPTDSMFRSAAAWLEMEFEDFKDGVAKANCGGVFGGDALWTFFGPNRHCDPKTLRDYRRYCMMTFEGQSKEDVDQLYADEDLGDKLKDQINAKINEADGKGYQRAMCCRASRTKEGELHFWINTGRSTQIDGWKTETEIEEFLKSDGVLVDRMRG